MVEAACKHLVGLREKNPGLRWEERGANALAQVQVALFNSRWDHPRPAAA